MKELCAGRNRQRAMAGPQGDSDTCFGREREGQQFGETTAKRGSRPVWARLGGTSRTRGRIEFFRFVLTADLTDAPRLDQPFPVGECPACLVTFARSS